MTTSNAQSALLAHLRNRFKVGPENLATEALAFILNTYPAARAAFVEHCTHFGGLTTAIDRFTTQDWSAEDAAIPDLIGVSGDRSPLIIEVKFQAGLTPNQPTTYMQRLFDTEGGGLLLFLVPDSRTRPVWNELKARCQKKGWPLEGETPALHAAAFGNVRLAVTPWSAVLNVLNLALRPVTDQRAFWELQQLRSLCEYEDQQIFEPLEASDLDKRIARRILEYRDLIFEVVTNSLPAAGIADPKGFGMSSSYEQLGRYFRLVGWECSLTVNWRLWATQEHQSPIWLHISDRRAEGYPPMMSALSTLERRGVVADGDLRRICIDVPVGQERDEVLKVITAQVAAVAELLPAPPPGQEVGATAFDDVQDLGEGPANS